MQVYAWRTLGSDVGRRLKRPHEPWSLAELDGLPTDRAVARRIFDEMVIPRDARDGGGQFRVGVCSDPSPSIGVYHEGMAELSRHAFGDRVHITWIRGFWESLHVIYRAAVVQDAHDFARELVERARSETRRVAPKARLDIKSAGEGATRAAPYFVYLLVGRGRRAGAVGRLNAGEPVHSGVT